MRKNFTITNVTPFYPGAIISSSSVIKGLSPIPASWGAVPTNSLATDIDCSRYEVKDSFGLQVDKATKFFQLKCVL